MNPNYGSKRPLNWQEPTFIRKVEKSTPHKELVESHHRMGTPITRKGAYNGVLPTFQPNPYIPELNPELTLKSVGQDDWLRQFEGGPYFDEARKLCEQELDLEEERLEGRKESIFDKMDRLNIQKERLMLKQSDYINNQINELKDAIKDKLSEISESEKSVTKEALGILKAFGMPQVPLRSEQQQQAPVLAQPKAPGFNSVATSPIISSPHQDPIGMTPSGAHIYPDPFHPAHQNFDKEDHAAAADHHQKLAVNAPPNEKVQHMQAAQAHTQMGQDNQSPMERAANKFGNGIISNNQPPGGRVPLPGQGLPQKPPMSPTLESSPKPNPQSNPPVGGSGPGMGLAPKATPPSPPSPLMGVASQQSVPTPPPPSAPGPMSGKPPMGTPQGQPPMGVQPPHGLPPSPTPPIRSPGALSSSPGGMGGPPLSGSPPSPSSLPKPPSPPSPPSPPLGGPSPGGLPPPSSLPPGGSLPPPPPVKSTPAAAGPQPPNPTNPDQGKPISPPFPERTGPRPGMVERLPPAASTSQLTMPPPSSTTIQAPIGMPQPMKQTGPASPPTHAGNQLTQPDILPPEIKTSEKPKDPELDKFMRMM